MLSVSLLIGSMSVVMISVRMISVRMLSVSTLSVVMFSVSKLSAVMRSVVMLSVRAPRQQRRKNVTTLATGVSGSIRGPAKAHREIRDLCYKTFTTIS